MEISKVQIEKDRAALDACSTLSASRHYAGVMTDHAGIVRICGDWWDLNHVKRCRGQAERLYWRVAGQWNLCPWPGEPKPG